MSEYVDSNISKFIFFGDTLVDPIFDFVILKLLHDDNLVLVEGMELIIK